MKHKLFGLAVAVMLGISTGCSTIGEQQTVGSYVGDTVVTSRVKAALIEDEQVSGYSVEVQTYEGVVQLSGFLNTHSERRRALAIAKKVKGVDEVRDAIVVRR